MNQIEQLKALYMEAGKHSNYQSLSRDLQQILPQEQLVTLPRYDAARLKYICSQIDFSGKKVLDIGGNTGFFTFEALRAGARHVDYYEGNKTHAEFVKIAAKVLECENQVDVFSEYYMFEQRHACYDIVFCLNVIHHLGDDFKQETDMESAKKEMLSCVNKLSDATDIMIFQMGFNWCGKKEYGLFKNGTKLEMEQYLKEGTRGYWNILSCGVPVKHNNTIQYQEMEQKNNYRIDSLGEFLNRPIFILKSQRSL